MENEVQQALAVMDKQTGQILNYRQLLPGPKYKKALNILAANEFGQLAQGVGGRIKGTNTICFIYQHKVPKDRMKDVTYRQLGATSNQKNQKQTEQDSQLVVTGSITRVVLQPQQLKCLWPNSSSTAPY
jgi:hypothetical protein